DRLPVVVVKAQPIKIAGEIFHVSREAVLRRKITAANHPDVAAALVDEDGLPRLRAGSLQLVKAAVEEGVPLHRHVIEAGAPVTEVAVGRPTTPAVVMSAY